MVFNLEKLLCMIICFILVTKKRILCGQAKKDLQTDKLAGDGRNTTQA